MHPCIATPGSHQFASVGRQSVVSYLGAGSSVCWCWFLVVGSQVVVGGVVSGCENPFADARDREVSQPAARSVEAVG